MPLAQDIIRRFHLLGEERDFNMDTRTVRERTCVRAYVYYVKIVTYVENPPRMRIKVKKYVAYVSVKITWIHVVQTRTNGIKLQITNQVLIIFHTEWFLRKHVISGFLKTHTFIFLFFFLMIW